MIIGGTQKYYWEQKRLGKARGLDNREGLLGEDYIIFNIWKSFCYKKVFLRRINLIRHINSVLIYDIYIDIFNIIYIKKGRCKEENITYEGRSDQTRIQSVHTHIHRTFQYSPLCLVAYSKKPLGVTFMRTTLREIVSRVRPGQTVSYH